MIFFLIHLNGVLKSTLYHLRNGFILFFCLKSLVIPAGLCYNRMYRRSARLKRENGA